MNVLSVENLTISYRSGGLWREVVHRVSFTIKRGEMLAFVGESGSGKTTTAQAIIGLLAENARLDAGTVRLNGEEISRWSGKRLDNLRGARISLVPQDPGNSLNPVQTIGAQVGEILRLHQKSSKTERRQQVIALLEKVGLSHPEQRFDQYPHQLSGGMKQRVLIAIAIALKPDLIIADEPTSALDVTVQKRSSICSIICAANPAPRCYLSPMTSRWRRSVPTGWWFFVTVKFRNRAIRVMLFAPRSTAIPASCCAICRDRTCT